MINADRKREQSKLRTHTHARTHTRAHTHTLSLSVSCRKSPRMLRKQEEHKPNKTTSDTRRRVLRQKFTDAAVTGCLHLRDEEAAGSSETSVDFYQTTWWHCLQVRKKSTVLLKPEQNLNITSCYLKNTRHTSRTTMLTYVLNL